MPESRAKPFLKWAGGKSQLLNAFVTYYPAELAHGSITNYFEPFLGAGAVFFYLAQKYRFKSAFLSDVNEELIVVFKVVQEQVEPLIEELDRFSRGFFKLDPPARKARFYEIREQYNSNRRRVSFKQFRRYWILRAAQFIFLNKTCYNGLFRVNRDGLFNVPFGRYRNPCIVDADNLRNASRALGIAEITVADFEAIGSSTQEDAFIYYDPPYKPISRTARFTSYSRHNFDDHQQVRLAEFFKEMDRKGVKQMLSNSDPRNVDPDDGFFDELYAPFNIYRIPANRAINSDARKRGNINELVITNYPK
ncbi:Dam family site-specific DNA-(adenine-N6)-methyltransferase [candidate division KSB1 bacterium]|nr:Dam family site-specific DNA-(adenine-N6)-methyltransferase [candidate division KSB1 bacterium]